MADECIHGLEVPLCDICYPKAKPEPVRAPAATRPRDVRPLAGPRATSRTPPRRATRPPAGKPVNLGQQRLFHLTHVDNLEGILIDGVVSAGAIPTIDISAPSTREERRAATVAGPGSGAVASFVPFFLTPDARVWSDIRSKTIDPRLSTGVRRFEPAEFVFLVTTVAAAGDGIVLADGDAAAASTRFASTPATEERMLRRLLPDEDAIASAEALVPDRLPLERVTLVGVAHDRARDAVRDLFRQTVFAPRIAVHPPWFARPE